ncbi:MAG: 16S rRNA (adenine(1518)-N(6)/adenine(1519)-N(6))-dimethyltransferase, partial [Candidatus Zambryskibacteria bacterium]|nr:16S rRNA (adenine(1518)-N(6)/adenine(1519)-N(6))-dimethyltransferase [Candidatus Zambryskibacteria bacterium]
MRAKKSLGQHFLRSQKALSSIIKAGDLKPSDVVLEIGPGDGTLTDKLLETGCLVLGIEKDDGLYEMLRVKYHKEVLAGQLTLIHDDILKFEFKNYNLDPRAYKLISNIP